jgi:hypothetical protein
MANEDICEVKSIFGLSIWHTFDEVFSDLFKRWRCESVAVVLFLLE